MVLVHKYHLTMMGHAMSNEQSAHYHYVKNVYNLFFFSLHFIITFGCTIKRKTSINIIIISFVRFFSFILFCKLRFMSSSIFLL